MNRKTIFSLVFLLSMVACRDPTEGLGGVETSGEEAGDPSDEGGRGLPPTADFLPRGFFGFGGWGGISRSGKYIHIADPAALVLADPKPQGRAFSAGFGIDPAEIASPELER